MPAPAWQQQLVDKMVPTDADGHPLPYTDAELWGPAFNNVLRRLEPGHDINCVATAAAHVQTRLGRPVVTDRETIDAMTMARGDVRALGGQVGGTRSGCKACSTPSSTRLSRRASWPATTVRIA